MSDQVTYYALLLEGDTPSHPSGIARRRTESNGNVKDESFKKDGSWGYTAAIACAKRGDLTFDFVEISEEEADRIVEQFRVKWGAQS